ncbi:heavy-metal-associated domain-containing protein [Burkholderia stagnalis]|uniref:heavy-metal-associated domain-containing protein n=1 Tax=Burkholderia stagnalis TaxID=1503054 RepID=UPI0007554BAF|nr:heavy-metal-associated domain-containing protein [Burkholderia stagnalis]KVM90228.1 hypothetical protein WT05_02115 [Burkholderia stagnalis]
MEFMLDHAIDDAATQDISHQIRTVDPDAEVQVDPANRTVHVDSWLFAEEFFVAFDDAGYTVVRINDR